MLTRKQQRKFSKTLTADGLLKEFRELGDQELDRQTEAPSDLGTWAMGVPIILDGKPFSFKKHEYLEIPYADNHPYQVERKAAQLGLTVKALLKSLWYCRYLGVVGVGYFFPSRSDAIDLSRGRLGPLIEENIETLGSWVQETDSSVLKRVWNASLYIRGMRSTVGMKSISLDFVCLDELDEASPFAIDKIMERMAHSQLKHVLMLSNPSLPDYGIDAQFQLTDQQFWLLKCEKCNTYTCLEDSFPSCLLEVNGKVIRACDKCKAELNPANGTWVAKRPQITEMRGRQYSQLWSVFAEPSAILHKYRTTNNMADFMNLVVGLPYIEAQNRLSVEEVLALCGSDGIASSDPGPCSMGVDVGRGLHVVIGKRMPHKMGKIVHVGEYADFEELDRLMKAFNIWRCVIDALPETRASRAFSQRFPGRVYLSYYSHHQKGSYAWNDGDFLVTSNRTESLDASHVEIMRGQLILPRESDVVRTFARHLHNIGKKLVEDEETGSKRYVYLRLGSEDHYRHALNFECMCRQFASSGFFADAVF